MEECINKKEGPKVAISCDSLIQRDDLTPLIEGAIAVFPQSEIYTLVHQRGGILGPIEMRKIHSSYLSHKIKSVDELHQKSYLVPSAAKNLFIPCHYDLVICISSGPAPGIKKCHDTKQITYLYDLPMVFSARRGLLRRFFSSFLKTYLVKSLKHSDKIFVSHEKIRHQLESWGIDSEILRPPFNADDFPIISSPVFTYDHVAISTEGLTPPLAKDIIKRFSEKGRRFKFFGPDDHLLSIKNGTEDKAFFGDRCSGELAPLLSGALCCVDFSQGLFPLASLKGLSSGRPIVSTEIQRSHFGSSEGVYYINPNVEELDQILLEIENLAVETKKLRALAHGFHEVRFKSKLKKAVEGLSI